jgi:hypothetical protein
MGLAGDLAIDVRIPLEAHEAVAVVRAEVIGAELAILEVGRFVAEAVARLAGECGVGHELVHEADDERMIGQLLQGTADGGSLVLGNGFRVRGKPDAERPHRLDVIVRQDARNQQPPILVENVLLLLDEFDDR